MFTIVNYCWVIYLSLYVIYFYFLKGGVGGLLGHMVPLSTTLFLKIQSYSSDVCAGKATRLSSHGGAPSGGYSNWRRHQRAHQLPAHCQAPEASRARTRAPGIPVPHILFQWRLQELQPYIRWWVPWNIMPMYFLYVSDRLLLRS